MITPEIIRILHVNCMSIAKKKEEALGEHRVTINLQATRRGFRMKCTCHHLNLGLLKHILYLPEVIVYLDFLIFLAFSVF